MPQGALAALSPKTQALLPAILPCVLLTRAPCDSQHFVFDETTINQGSTRPCIFQQAEKLCTVGTVDECYAAPSAPPSYTYGRARHLGEETSGEESSSGWRPVSCEMLTDHSSNCDGNVCINDSDGFAVLTVVAPAASCQQHDACNQVHTIDSTAPGEALEDATHVRWHQVFSGGGNCFAVANELTFDYANLRQSLQNTDVMTAPHFTVEALPIGATSFSRSMCGPNDGLCSSNWWKNCGGGTDHTSVKFHRLARHSMQAPIGLGGTSGICGESGSWRYERIEVFVHSSSDVEPVAPASDVPDSYQGGDQCEATIDCCPGGPGGNMCGARDCADEFGSPPCHGNHMRVHCATTCQTLNKPLGDVQCSNWDNTDDVMRSFSDINHGDLSQCIRYCRGETDCVACSVGQNKNDFKAMRRCDLAHRIHEDFQAATCEPLQEGWRYAQTGHDVALDLPNLAYGSNTTLGDCFGQCGTTPECKQAVCEAIEVRRYRVSAKTSGVVLDLEGKASGRVSARVNARSGLDDVHRRVSSPDMSRVHDPYSNTDLAAPIAVL